MTSSGGKGREQVITVGEQVVRPLHSFSWDDVRMLRSTDYIPGSLETKSVID